MEDPDEDDDDGKCTVIVALMQKNRRSRRNMGSDCLTIGFAIYAVTERDLAQKPMKMNFFKYNASVARSPAFINLREVNLINLFLFFFFKLKFSPVILWIFRSVAVLN